MESHDNSSADLNQEGGPQEVADQPQRFKTLGTHLAALRKSLGVTQQQLAERSALTRFPFDRTFVAHVESGNASPSTARFLSYLSLLHADPNSVLKLVDIAIDHGSVPLGLEYREYVQQARARHEELKDDEALSWLLVGLRQAEQNGEKAWAARIKIGAAIVLRSRGMLLLGRRMAEEAVNCPELDATDRTRAAIVVSQVCRQCDEYDSAHAFLYLAEALDPKDNDLLTTQLVHTKGVLEFTLKNHNAAADYFQQALDGYERLGMRHEEALLRALLSKVNWQLGRRTDVESGMQLAVATIRRWPARRHMIWVLRHAGWLAMEKKQFKEARKLLLEAELLAKDAGQEEYLIGVRSCLLELALRSQDAPLIHFMRAYLLKKAPTANLDPIIRDQLKNVLAHLQSEPTSRRPSKSKGK